MNNQPGLSSFWYWWLFIVVTGIMLFGLGMFFFPGAFLDFFSLLFFADSSLISSQIEPEAQRYVFFAHNVLGTVIFGWGVLLMMLLRGPIRKGNAESLKYFFISIFAWLVPDSALSLWAGFWQNAVLNVVIAGFLLLPLLLSKKRAQSTI